MLNIQGFLGDFREITPDQMLIQHFYHCPCPPARDLDSRVPGLVASSLKRHERTNLRTDGPTVGHLLNRELASKKDWIFGYPIPSRIQAGWGNDGMG